MTCMTTVEIYIDTFILQVRVIQSVFCLNCWMFWYHMILFSTIAEKKNEINPSDTHLYDKICGDTATNLIRQCSDVILVNQTSFCQIVASLLRTTVAVFLEWAASLGSPVMSWDHRRSAVAAFGFGSDSHIFSKRYKTRQLQCTVWVGTEEKQSHKHYGLVSDIKSIQKPSTLWEHFAESPPSRGWPAPPYALSSPSDLCSVTQEHSTLGCFPCEYRTRSGA